MRTEPFVVPRELRFVPGEKAERSVVVFGRSQAEMAFSRDSALDRLRDLGSRIGRDGMPQLVREIDEATPGEIGTYVVNREGSPLAAEIELIDEVRKLRRGVRAHRDSTGHELCWHHPALWGLLPEKQDPLPAVPEWPAFLRGCIRYRQSLDEQAPAALRSSQPYDR